jgi:CubicO group peptidase (beta-lactamase class C family)
MLWIPRCREDGRFKKHGEDSMTRITRRTALTQAAVGAALAGTLPAAAFAKSAPGGFSAERLAKITPLVQSYLDKGPLAGIVDIVCRHGEIAHVDALGWQDVENKVAMKRDSIFRIASMTKPTVGAATLILMDEGKLSLTDPVEKFLPELANRKVLRDLAGPLDNSYDSPRSITIEDLMTHRSGIITPDNGKGPLVDAIVAADTKGRAEGPDAWIKAVGELPLAYKPGTEFRYGNSIDVLGVLVARAAGIKLGEFLQSRIFGPLGMVDTGFWVPEKKQSRLCVPYTMEASGQRVKSTAARPLDKPPAFESGAGGLVSTADDYLKFARMLLGKGKLGNTRILSHNAVGLMTVDHLTPDQRRMPFQGIRDYWSGQGFGLTVAVIDNVARWSPSNGYSSAGSFYWPGATACQWQADPKEDMITIHMVQLTNGFAATPFNKIREAAYEAIED